MFLGQLLSSFWDMAAHAVLLGLPSHLGVSLKLFSAEPYRNHEDSFRLLTLEKKHRGKYSEQKKHLIA